MRFFVTYNRRSCNAHDKKAFQLLNFLHAFPSCISRSHLCPSWTPKQLHLHATNAASMGALPNELRKRHPPRLRASKRKYSWYRVLRHVHVSFQIRLQNDSKQQVGTISAPFQHHFSAILASSRRHAVRSNRSRERKRGRASQQPRVQINLVRVSSFRISQLFAAVVSHGFVGKHAPARMPTTYRRTRRCSRHIGFFPHTRISATSRGARYCSSLGTHKPAEHAAKCLPYRKHQMAHSGENNYTPTPLLPVEIAIFM